MQPVFSEKAACRTGGSLCECRFSRQTDSDFGKENICAVILMYDFRAIPHKDCATDASSNFSSDETKSGVNT